MKSSLIAIVCVSLILVCMQTAYGFQDVGEDFGTSWLEQHGSKPGSAIETQQSLWNWGATPKGYLLLNGTLYPPGFWPQYYYPSFPIGADPIVINNTKTANYVSPSLLTSNSGYEDPWLLSQLSGRPVSVVNIPRGTLF
jgi:hypothetical protein